MMRALLTVCPPLSSIDQKMKKKQCLLWVFSYHETLTCDNLDMHLLVLACYGLCVPTFDCEAGTKCFFYLSWLKW